MIRPRFGELLGKFVQLSPHDVSEILEDQSSSRRRFGEIALALGFCKPQHVWRAWWSQLSGAPDRVNLDEVGIDAQCICLVPAQLAREFNVIPIRASGSQAVIAAAEGALMRAMEELPRRIKMQLKFVLADGVQIREAIETYYPSLRASERDAAVA